MLVYIIIVLIYRCKDKPFNAWLSSVRWVDIDIYDLSALRSGRRSRPPKIFDVPEEVNCQPGAQLVRCLVNRRKSTRVGTGRSNFGAVVGGGGLPLQWRRLPHAIVTFSPFLKQRKPSNQQEQPEDAVMFNKRADYGTGRHLLNIIALPNFLRKHCPSLEKPEDHGASSITSARRRKLSTPLVPADKLTQS